MWQRETSLWIELMLLIRWPWDKEINEDYLVGRKVIIGVLRNKEAEESVSEEDRKSLETGKGKEIAFCRDSERNTTLGHLILAYWDPFQTSDSRTVRITNVCHLKSRFFHYLWLAANAIADSRVSIINHPKQQGQCMKGYSQNIGWISGINVSWVWRSRVGSYLPHLFMKH